MKSPLSKKIVSLFLLGGGVITGILFLFASGSEGQMPPPVQQPTYPSTPQTGITVEKFLKDAKIGNSLVHIVRELRDCIGAKDSRTAKRFDGVEDLCDPLEFPRATARETLAKIAGTGPTGKERGANNLIDYWNLDPEETAYLKKVTSSLLFGGIGTPDSKSTDSTAENAQNEDYWTSFRKKLPPSQNSAGRSVLAKLATLSKQAELESGLAALAQYDKPFPLFDGELADAKSALDSPSLAKDRIARSSLWNAEVQRLLVEHPRELVLAAQDALVPAAASSPDQPLPNPLLGERGQAAVRSVAFGSLTGAAAGRAVETSGLGSPSSQIPSDFVSADFLQALSARISDQLQGNLGSLGNVLNFLGPNAGSIGTILGNEQFNSLAQSFGPGLRPSGGGFIPNIGSGSLSNLSSIPKDSQPPDTTCAARTPQVSEEEAQSVAALLGLPLSSDPTAPWRTKYIGSGSLYGVSGTLIPTNTPITLGPTQFPDTSACVWAISVALPESRHVILLEDVRSENGVKIHLQIP